MTTENGGAPAGTVFHPLKTFPKRGFIARNLKLSSSFRNTYEHFFPNGTGTILEFGCGGNFHSYLAASYVGCKGYKMVDTIQNLGEVIEDIMEDIYVTGAREDVEGLLGYKLPGKRAPLSPIVANMAYMTIEEESVDVAVALGLGSYDEVGQRNRHWPSSMNVSDNVMDQFQIDYIQEYGDVTYSRALKIAAKAVKRGGIFIVSDYLKNTGGKDASYLEEARRLLEGEGFREVSHPEEGKLIEDGKSMMIVMRKVGY